LAAFTPGYGETHKDVTVRFSQQVQPLTIMALSHIQQGLN
jgi:hypothetical protein